MPESVKVDFKIDTGADQPAEAPDDPVDGESGSSSSARVEAAAEWLFLRVVRERELDPSVHTWPPPEMFLEGWREDARNLLAAIDAASPSPGAARVEAAHLERLDHYGHDGGQR